MKERGNGIGRTTKTDGLSDGRARAENASIPLDTEKLHIYLNTYIAREGEIEEEEEEEDEEAVGVRALVLGSIKRIPAISDQMKPRKCSYETKTKI